MNSMGFLFCYALVQYMILLPFSNFLFRELPFPKFWYQVSERNQLLLFTAGDPGTNLKIHFQNVHTQNIPPCLHWYLGPSVLMPVKSLSQKWSGPFIIFKFSLMNKTFGHNFRIENDEISNCLILPFYIKEVQINDLFSALDLNNF